MTLSNGRAPRSGVTSLRESRSFVTFCVDTEPAQLTSLAGRVDTEHSCTPERLHS